MQYNEIMLDDFLTGRYLDKKQALHVLTTMGIAWTDRQIALTAEPDATGRRLWPWFLDDKGTLRIDEGFIRETFRRKQAEALNFWNPK